MGTTCVAAILHDGVLTVGNAGDSRAYLLREGKLRQITEDHSQVWQEVLAGKMTREEAQKSKFRNAITKSIGLGGEVDADIKEFDLIEGDTLLLCSDGLTTEVGDQDIADILASAANAQAACERLTDAALRKGGSDNITVVVLRYGDFTPLGGAEIEPERVTAGEEDATDERAEWRHRRGRQWKRPRSPRPLRAERTAQTKRTRKKRITSRQHPRAAVAAVKVPPKTRKSATRGAAASLPLSLSRCSVCWRQRASRSESRSIRGRLFCPRPKSSL